MATKEKTHREKLVEIQAEIVELAEKVDRKTLQPRDAERIDQLHRIVTHEKKD